MCRSARKRTKPAPVPALCGYRLMWVLVMFDLPVTTKDERYAATRFRLDLFDMGFERCQYSVYLRFVEGYAQATGIGRRVQRCVPEGGKVYLLNFTDKQYESMVRYENSKRCTPPKSPKQFELF